MACLTIVRAGPQTTVQDLGRPNHRREGVSLGGALDRQAARVANLLVGNPETAALLEITLGPAVLRFPDRRAIAWGGGEFPLQIEVTEIPAGRAACIDPEEELTVGPARRGARAWLAISGGIDLPPLLGSRATDLRAGFGGLAGRALRDGDELPLGVAAPPNQTGRVATWGAPADWMQTSRRILVLRVVRGAEWPDFKAEARSVLQEESFVVSPQSDRMGARLAGRELRRRAEIERLSEAVVPGTIQVPNDGQPIILLGDCQTIGGYPRIAHVITVDLPLAAQLRPNDVVRFREVTLAEARAFLVERESDFDLFRAGIRLRTL
ncbi:MAG: biotin-dependent carboxyltransferase family protein [Chthoniobacterales bacterium]